MGLRVGETTRFADGKMEGIHVMHAQYIIKYALTKIKVITI
jgi:hypothetical protein